MSVWAFANGARVGYIDGVVFKNIIFTEYFSIIYRWWEVRAVVDVAELGVMVVYIYIYYMCTQYVNILHYNICILNIENIFGILVYECCLLK